MTAATTGRAGLRRLLGRLTSWRLAPRWYAAALLPVALYGLGAAATNASLGGEAVLDPAVLRTILFSLSAGPLVSLLLRGAMLAAPISRRLVERMRSTQTDALTAREIEVLRHVASGNTNADVAAALHISTATVKTHLLHIYSKLDVSDRAAAVSRAYQTGILSP